MALPVRPQFTSLSLAGLLASVQALGQALVLALSLSAQASPAAPPSSKTPSAGAGLRVLSAQAGLFGTVEDVAPTFTPSNTVPLRDGQVFGWRMKVDTTQRRVRVVEELTLPQEPRTWGDPEPGLKRKTSADGRTATTDTWLEPREGFISHTWVVTQGDPKGTWVLKVVVEGQPPQVFRLEAR
jgi:hypothetical protein